MFRLIERILNKYSLAVCIWAYYTVIVISLDKGLISRNICGVYYSKQKREKSRCIHFTLINISIHLTRRMCCNSYGCGNVTKRTYNHSSTVRLYRI